MVFAGLVAAPIAAFAADPVVAGDFDSSVTITKDPDGAGMLYTLTDDVTTFSTITMPNDATLDGAGHKITAVEDATHPVFPGAVVASAMGNGIAAAHLDVKDLNIQTDGFAGEAKNSGGKLAGIAMYRAGGSLTNVSVDGVSHGSGVQEGWGIAIRNSKDPLDEVGKENINVPRAQVALENVDISHFQKAGLLLDGNLTFTVKNAEIGQGTGPQGLPNPNIAANSLQISRGASGSVANSTVKLNSHADAAGVLLYNARKVDFDGVTVDGDAAATSGIYVWNPFSTVDTTFTMRGGAVTRSATPAAGTTGLTIDGPAGSITATVTGTKFTGWSSATSGPVTTTTTTPAVAKVDVSGNYKATRPHARRLRVDLSAFTLGANQAEGSMLRWTIKVDGHRAASIRQHAGDSDVWAQTFRVGTGTHTVQILKNGVSQRTFKVRTR
jgi:hypothetical protein